MARHDERRALAKVVKDSARKPALVGNQVVVPLKFDEDGTPISSKNFNPTKHLKRLTLTDLRFLKAWRDSGWDIAKACQETGIKETSATRLVRKLQVFKDEEERIKALADIPTTPWIAAKHTENVFEGKLDESQRDSLKELSKIIGAYKPTTNINVQANVLQMPQLTPEQAKAAREFFDTMADNHAA